MQTALSQNIEKQEEEARFIKAAQSLEDDPLGETAKETRKWALMYSQNVDYPFCDKLSTIFFAAEVRGEVMSQYLIKAGSYHLEQNGKKYNINNGQFAALASALTVYEKIIEKDSTAKYKQFDELIKFRNNNQLMKFVEYAKCK